PGSLKMRTVPTDSSRSRRKAARAVTPAPKDARQTTTTVSLRRPITPRLPEGRLAKRGHRGVRELPEEPAHHKGGDFADVDGVVADALECPRDHRHVHRPLARVGVLADVDRELEDLAVEAVDLAVLAGEVLGQRDVAGGEGGAALDDLRARRAPHAQDA